MPARARLDQKKGAITARPSSQYPSTRQIMAGPAPQTTRLKQALGLTERTLHTIERISPPMGLTFPGRIHSSLPVGAR